MSSCEIDIKITLLVDFSPGKYIHFFYFKNTKNIFTESVLSYNIPQGMVRGATLELLDISYDGVEDPSNGYLTGGLGQLVDGKFGAENYRAMGENGVVRGENGGFSSQFSSVHYNIFL